MAAEEIREWVEGPGGAFAGLSFNIQAVLDAHTNSSNPLQTMSWMRKVAETTVQMGREIADGIHDGDAVLLPFRLCADDALFDMVVVWEGTKRCVKEGQAGETRPDRDTCARETKAVKIRRSGRSDCWISG